MGEKFSGLSMGGGTEKWGAGPRFKSLGSESWCSATTPELFVLFCLLFLPPFFLTKSSCLLPEKILCVVLPASVTD